MHTALRYPEYMFRSFAFVDGTKRKRKMIECTLHRRELLLLALTPQGILFFVFLGKTYYFAFFVFLSFFLSDCGTSFCAASGLGNKIKKGCAAEMIMLLIYFFGNRDDVCVR